MSAAPRTTTQTTTEAATVEQMAPSPSHFFLTATSYLGTAAIKSAVELDVFTAIADGAHTVEQIADRCQASQRGIRILCDYLTINKFLTKEGNRYDLTHDSFVFLNRHSPAYIGTAVDFLVRPDAFDSIRDLTGTIKRGTRDASILQPDNSMWVTFAKAMAPMAAMQAGNLADLLQVSKAGRIRVLDIAAGHGLYGITAARQNPQAEIVALDWPSVLEVAKENAKNSGVDARYKTIAGNAFEVDLGRDYDLVLITNFLHHVDEATNVAFLRRVHDALKNGGRAAALEFVPDENRVTPEIPASFSMIMLAMTPSGDAYTFKQLQKMFADAGFGNIELHGLAPSQSRVVTARK